MAEEPWEAFERSERKGEEKKLLEQLNSAHADFSAWEATHGRHKSPAVRAARLSQFVQRKYPDIADRFTPDIYENWLGAVDEVKSITGEASVDMAQRAVRALASVIAYRDFQRAEPKKSKDPKAFQEFVAEHHAEELHDFSHVEAEDVILSVKRVQDHERGNWVLIAIFMIGLMASYISSCVNDKKRPDPPAAKQPHQPAGSPWQAKMDKNRHDKNEERISPDNLPEH